MPGDFLYRQSETLIAVALFVLLLLAGEVGYRCGRRSHASANETTRAQVSTIQAAILGIFGLLLAFTFAMAESRFDARRRLVIDEANAIGTAALRGRLLPEPQRAEVARLFPRYLEARLEANQARRNAPSLRAAEERTDRLTDELWAHAVAAGERDPRAVPTGLFIQSLNETIDVRDKWKAALDGHTPRASWCSCSLRRWSPAGSSATVSGSAVAGP